MMRIQVTAVDERTGQELTLSRRLNKKLTSCSGLILGTFERLMPEILLTYREHIDSFAGGTDKDPLSIRVRRAISGQQLAGKGELSRVIGELLEWKVPPRAIFALLTPYAASHLKEDCKRDPESAKWLLALEINKAVAVLLDEGTEYERERIEQSIRKAHG